MNQIVLMFAFIILSSMTSTFAEEKRIEQIFPAEGISTVILRASAAERASVNVSEKSSSIRVSGKPTGGAAGYHSSDPNWKETSAGEWGLDFVAKQFGSTLVVSSKNEMAYIHHHYVIEDIQIEIPKEVKLVQETRQLSGDGAADLKKP